MLSFKLPNIDREIDGELEKEYRLHLLKRDMRNSAFFIALLVLLAGVLAYLDFQLAKGPVLFYLIVFRALFIVAGMFIWIYMRRNETSKKTGIYIFVWSLAGVGMFIFTNITRPVIFSQQLIVSVIIIFAIYLTFFSSVKLRMALALLLTTGVIVSVLNLGESGTITYQIATVVTLLAVNAIGLHFAQYFSAFRRTQFTINRDLLKQIKERKKAEESLAASEAKFRRVFETSLDVQFITSMNGQILDASRSAEHILGYSLEELRGMNAAELYAAPENRPEYTGKLLKDGFVDNYEMQFRRKDSQAIDVAINAKLIKDEQGCIIGTQGSFRDVTERKRAGMAVRESERKFRELAEMLPAIVFEIDLKGTLIFANNRAIKHFGEHDLQKEKINIFDYIVPESRGPAVANIKKVAAGEKVDPGEYMVMNKDGQLLPVLASTGVIKNNQGTVTGLRGILVDITERKQAEEQLRGLYDKEKNLREELQEEASARGMFINVLGHELRTPLTPLVASTGMLRELLDEKGQGIEKKLVNNIHNSVCSLGERLEELLDLARISRGTFTIQKQPVDIAALIQRLVDSYKVLFEQQKKTLKVNLEPTGLKEIDADPIRLEQVINNLLSNAIKYSPADSRVSLTVCRTDTELMIEVQDQGHGIAPEDQKKLFQPYHRVEQDRQNYPGIGLGLAVCKQIVDAHGGKITIESEIGKGAAFKVCLPVKGNTGKGGL